MLPSRRRFLLGSSTAVAAVLLQPWSWPVHFFAANAPEADDLPLDQTRLMMGTLVSVRTARAPGHAADASAGAVDAAFAEAARLEALLTRHDPTAPLGLLNRQGAIRDVPPDLRQVLALAAQVAGSTEQAFNPLAVTVAEAGRRGASGAELKRLEGLAGPGGLRVDKAGLALASAELVCSLDGIAKGYIVDAMSRVLRRYGVADHLINAGGDIYAAGSPGGGRPWIVGIKGPRGRVTRLVHLRDGALATSGNAESLARGYEHIPPVRMADTGGPRPFSASVAASGAVLADACATAMFALPPARAAQAAARNGVELTLIGA